MISAIASRSYSDVSTNVMRDSVPFPGLSVGGLKCPKPDSCTPRSRGLAPTAEVLKRAHTFFHGWRISTTRKNMKPSAKLFGAPAHLEFPRQLAPQDPS